MLISKKACAIVSLIIAMSISAAFSKNKSPKVLKINLPISFEYVK